MKKTLALCVLSLCIVTGSQAWAVDKTQKEDVKSEQSQFKVERADMKKQEADLKKQSPVEQKADQSELNQLKDDLKKPQ